MASEQTTNTMALNKMTLDDFPLLFKIFVKPAFNTELLNNAGYDHIATYFFGTNSDHKFVGWNGLRKKSTVEGNIFDDLGYRCGCCEVMSLIYIILLKSGQ